MRGIVCSGAVALSVAWAAVPAMAAPVTLLCSAVPGISHVTNEPDTLILDEAAGTVDFTEGAYHYAPPLQFNAPTRHVGTFPASFSQNEITFKIGLEVYRLNRLSGRFSDYNAQSGVHLDRDMDCHVQQRQF